MNTQTAHDLITACNREMRSAFLSQLDGWPVSLTKLDQATDRQTGGTYLFATMLVHPVPWRKSGAVAASTLIRSGEIDSIGSAQGMVTLMDAKTAALQRQIIEHLYRMGYRPHRPNGLARRVARRIWRAVADRLS